MKFSEVNLNFFYGFKCNYSCHGCSTGSNVTEFQTKDPDFEKTLRSIKRASELFNVTSMITLIGGEPFLYWNSRILPLAQEVNRWFPKTRINVTTNGQLIGKNVDSIFQLSNMVDELSITVTRHLVGLNDPKVKNIWDDNMAEFLSHPQIVKINDDHFHIKNNIHANIYFYQPESWKSYYYRDKDNKIKPWATKDPPGSMRVGCTGSVCSTLFENRLYKCFTLATLQQQLQSLGQFDDPDWQKYVEYPFIDIDDIDEKLFAEYQRTYGKPTAYCDMCTNNEENNIKWKDRTFPMIFSRTIL